MNAAKQEKFITESEYHELLRNLDSVRRINAQLGKGQVNRIKRIEALEAKLANTQERLEWVRDALKLSQEAGRDLLAERDALQGQLEAANKSIGHWGGKWGAELLRRCEAEAELERMRHAE